MTEEKKFNCALCNEKYESKEKLNEHFRIHAGKLGATQTSEQTTGQVPCDVCSQGFKTISLAIQHKYKKHPDAIMKYFCKFCGMQFPLKSTHDRHLETHSNDRPEGLFTCTECNAVFVTETGRKYHIKSAHNRISSLIHPVNTPPPSKKIRLNNANEAQSVYYCYLCGYPYINKFNLQRHLEKNHTETDRNTVPEDMLKCTTCDAYFYTKQAFDCHVIDHKPDDLYVTTEEQRLQTVKRVDQDFDIRRVQIPSEKYIPALRPTRKPSKTNSSYKMMKSKTNKDDSDSSLSPTSEIEDSSDEDPLVNKKHQSPTEMTLTTNRKVVKKKFYAIVDSNGTITKTCTNIPKNAVLTKSNLIKLKNTDILKTLKKSGNTNVTINLKNNKLDEVDKPVVNKLSFDKIQSESSSSKRNQIDSDNTSTESFSKKNKIDDANSIIVDKCGPVNKSELESNYVDSEIEKNQTQSKELDFNRKASEINQSKSKELKFNRDASEINQSKSKELESNQVVSEIDQTQSKSRGLGSNQVVRDTERNENKSKELEPNLVVSEDQNQSKVKQLNSNRVGSEIERVQNKSKKSKLNQVLSPKKKTDFKINEFVDRKCDLKIILDRLPEKYEKILRDKKNSKHM